MALACWLFPFKVNADKKGVGENGTSHLNTVFLIVVK